ncbi:uncharacterized protein SPPG_06428 [Spizellomyces punctatus DAOM BR117]|uniref:Uncharacterized protein n=1 Tax=Spizellomyces punctatus (strain DAOM BR117) TaxID=645134 RepID=A0A0L0HAT7_SPIPD|nr:uncharacterized protein SPPG_06428 [Spizellomyces punctatus DAOM BR117]KNC98009.1 hypothetical protein SPPG_06428 [Spizellomyces punctatus DAOM BR117]|eukprot:XP_016606049.1 hypothetical protein SPPG_06428 [Spizellomyces punctatus DAOM BR117]
MRYSSPSRFSYSTRAFRPIEARAIWKLDVGGVDLQSPTKFGEPGVTSLAAAEVFCITCEPLAVSNATNVAQDRMRKCTVEFDSVKANISPPATAPAATNRVKTTL